MSGAPRPSPVAGDGRLAYYVDHEHERRHTAHLRIEARLVELRALTPRGRVELYERLRAEYRTITGVRPEACVRRSRIRGDLTLLEMLGREARRTPSE